MKKTIVYSHKKVALDTPQPEPITPEEINEKNAQFWKEHKESIEKYIDDPLNPQNAPAAALWAEIHKAPEQQAEELAIMQQQITNKEKMLEQAIEQGWRIKQSELGSRPNSAATYAQEIAQHLLQQHSGKTKLKIWREISKNKNNPDTLQTLNGDIDYYRDGKELFFNMDGQEEQKITQKHFFNTYLVKKPKPK